MSQQQQPMLPPIQIQSHAHPPPPALLQQQQAPPQQLQPQYAPPHTNGVPMQYHGMQAAPYHYDPSMQHPVPPNGMSNAPPNGMANGQPGMRYPLPPPGMDAHQTPGSRHKKEIKRRTKTGCLTCRRRRIKCDEGHPSCRNCQKSKRDCLGYDPVFKAQAAPAAIQPALHSGSSAGPDSSPGSVPPQAYAPAPQGYAPAASSGYAPPAPTHPVAEQRFEYEPTLDPALANGQPPPVAIPQNTYTTSLRPGRRVHSLTIDELFGLGDAPPVLPPDFADNVSWTSNDLAEMKTMYRQAYAPALDLFFETPWYSMKGEDFLESDRATANFLNYCVNQFRRPPPTLQEDFQVLHSLEARLVWMLAYLPALIVRDREDVELTALLPRINTVQHLLTGTFLEAIILPPNPEMIPGIAPHVDPRFWHHLASFTTVHDDGTDPSADAIIATEVGELRSMLGTEHRDVLYSMAIARHFGGRIEEYRADQILVPVSNEPEDPIAKLALAQHLISEEDKNGTTQIVQRLCGMARRSWGLQRGQHIV